MCANDFEHNVHANKPRAGKAGTQHTHTHNTHTHTYSACGLLNSEAIHATGTPPTVNTTLPRK